MSSGLAGRVALVTGGSRGIGRAIALGLGADGADVAVLYRHDAGAAEETSRLLTTAGRRVVAVQADLAQVDTLAPAVDAVRAELGIVSILVHSGGFAPPSMPVADSDTADVATAMAVHALGPHRLCQLVLPAMRAQPRGDIIFVGSLAPTFNRPNGAAYNMSKSAAHSLASTLAKEEAPNGIRVNTVAPGLILTDLGRSLLQRAGVEDADGLGRRAPLGRWCEPDDVAGLVRFLVSDAGSYITGQVIAIDGGVDSAEVVRRSFL